MVDNPRLGFYLCRAVDADGTAGQGLPGSDLHQRPWALWDEPADVIRAVRIVEANVEALNNAWETYHGDQNTE